MQRRLYSNQLFLIFVRIRNRFEIAESSIFFTMFTLKPRCIIHLITRYSLESEKVFENVASGQTCESLIRVTIYMCNRMTHTIKQKHPRT